MTILIDANSILGDFLKRYTGMERRINNGICNTL